MGEDRQKKVIRLAVKQMIRGHDSTVAHAFRHTDGKCPKCACAQLHTMFCKPGQEDVEMPYVEHCRLDGEHLHRICSACGYLWVERCWDHAIAVEERGQLIAEGEAAMMLVALAHAQAGIRFNREHLETFRGWIAQFTREDDAIVLTAEPAPPQVGEIRHPRSPEDHISP